MKQLIPIVLLSCVLTLPVGAQVSMEVINGASFDRGAPVAPGSYAQVWGAYDGFPTEEATTRPLPSELGGVQVMIDDAAVPLYAVTPLVCAFIVPQGLAAGRHTIVVRKGGALVGSGDIDVAAIAPGVFFNNQVVPGEDAGGVRRAEDAAFALPETPARRGGTIVIALTGQGATVNDPPGDGFAPEGAGSTTTSDPEVYISSLKAQVTFSGLMPLFAGVWQINAIVPSEEYVKGMVPLVVTYKGRASKSVVFWVAE